MAKYQLPDATFVPHPQGKHEGSIVQVQDEGEQETPWGLKRKLSVRIESTTATMEDGTPFALVCWFTFSGASNSNLTKFRQSLMGRSLGNKERLDFDDAEMINRHVGYQVIHSKREDGTPRAQLASIWSIDGHGPGTEAKPSQADVDYYLNLVDAMVNASIITVDQGTQATDETKGLSVAMLNQRVERWEAKLKEKGTDLPKRTKPGEDDLPF